MSILPNGLRVRMLVDEAYFNEVSIPAIDKSLDVELYSDVDAEAVNQFKDAVETWWRCPKEVRGQLGETYPELYIYDELKFFNFMAYIVDEEDIQNG